MNKVILTGNMVADPIIKYTKDEVPVAYFQLAVNRAVKKGDEKIEDKIDCIAWNGLAKICAEYLTKGRLVAIEGKMQIRKYQGNDGKDHSKVEVLVENLQMLDTRGITKKIT